MAETGVILEFDTKVEKLKNVKKKIKLGTTGKAKLNNMRKLLASNSEQLKQKIMEYFERQRKMIDERETKLLNKVNMFIDCRITEIDDKLKHFQEKLDHFVAYQHYLEKDELPPDYSVPDDFDCSVVASRYEFCEKRNDLKSSFKKLGILRQADILVAKLDSSDEDESDDDINAHKNAFQDSLMKKFNPLNKIVETEFSDVASSCSILSFKDEEENEDKTKVRKVECLDDYEFLAPEVPSDLFREQPTSQVDTTLSANLNLYDSEDSKTTSSFEREKTIEKMLEAFKSRKANGTDIINKADCQIALENKVDSSGANEKSSLIDKLSDTIKICQSENEQKDVSAKAAFELKNFLISINKVNDYPSQELKTDCQSTHLKAIRSIDHISNFNSKVEAILNKDYFNMQNCIA